VVIVLLSHAHPATAQPQFFVGGQVIADVKRFSDTGASTPLSGTAWGGGGEAGVFVTPNWGVGVSLDAERPTNTSSAIPIGALAAPAGSPLSSFRSQVTNRITATSVLLGYRFPVQARVRVGALGGLAFLHVSRDYTTIGPPSSAAAPIAALVMRPLTQVDNVAAATVGGENAIDLSLHARLIGDVRVHAFSLSGGGPSGFAIRPSLGVRWTF
jgi:Outer membrane protein beta-barrel domain